MTDRVQTCGDCIHADVCARVPYFTEFSRENPSYCGDFKQMQKWIPVAERLPEDDLPKGSKVKQIKVLTALKSDKGVRTVRSQMRYRCTWYSDSEPWTWRYSGSKITHWMPLPEPPKEKENG